MGSFIRFAVVVAILIGAVRSISFAQSTGGFVTGSFGVINGAQGCVPYLVSKKTTLVQKLVDGTTIIMESVSREARDSQGRTMTEMAQALPRGSSAPGFKHTMVNDPTSHATFNWTSFGKQATVFHLPEHLVRPVSQVRNEVTGGVTTARAGFAIGSMGSGLLGKAEREVRQERLGGKTIAGVYAEGIRDTVTIPVGSEGNDRPMVTMHETWQSPDLGIVLLEIDEDPRTGTRTTEVTALDRGEPDAALFRVPEGYTLKEQSVSQQSN